MSALLSLPPTASTSASAPAPGLAAAAPDAENTATDAAGQEFAALFHKIAAQHAAAETQADPLAKTDAAAPEELAAALPFLEGMGLIALATPPTDGGLTDGLAKELAAISAVLQQGPGKGTAEASAPVTGLAGSSGAAEEGFAVLPLPTVGRATGQASGDQAEAAVPSAQGGGFAAATQAALDKPANPQAPAAISNAGHPSAPGAASGGLALPIAHPVGSPGWGQEVGNRIVWMASRNESQAELVLTPPQMGRVSVSITVTGDQAAASFASANPAVREALEAALPRLREILAEAGIQLGQAQVGAEHPGRSDREAPSGKAPFAKTSEDMAFAGEIGGGAASSVLKSGRGLVDVFA